jgi:putative hemolysin
LAVPLIYTVELLLTPVRWLLVTLLVEPATRLLRPAHVPVDAVSTEDLRALVEASARQEVLSTTENEMLQAVVGLADVSVRAVMVPRVEILAIRLHDDPQAIRSRFAESGKTKLPVCGRDLDDVKGLLYARDYYLGPDLPLSRLLRRVDFVPEQADLIQLIHYFRQRHSQLAVVVDEYGGVAGLVSLEDVLEEIVGDLPGSDHGDVPPAERLDENTYRLSGRISVREWSGLFEVPASHIQVDTLSGLVAARLGRLPHVGDTVRTGNLTLTVESMRRRRIDRLILRREPVPARGESLS